MAPRKQTQLPDFSRDIRPRGVASPTGAFMRPTADPTLTGLVEGLSALQPSLQRFSAQFQQQTAQEKQAEGVEAARDLVAKGLSLAEATRQGKLPQQDNPWFMAGFHEKMGQNDADKWRIKLMEDMLADPQLQDSTSTDDAVTFINQHRLDWLNNRAPVGKDDGFFAQGFEARADAYTQEELMKFASRLEDKINKKSMDMHFSQVKQHVEMEFMKGTTPEEIAQGVNILVQTQYSLGSKEKQLDDTTIQAVIAASMDMREDKALAVLNGVFGSKSGAELADTPAGAEAIDKARQDIRNRRWVEQEREIRTEDRRREEAVNQIMGDVITAKAKDPNVDLKVFIPDLIKKAKSPEAVARLVQFNNSVDALTNKTNEGVRGELFTRIFVYEPGDQTTEEDVALARFNNQLTTEDAAALISQIRAARESGQNADQGIWSDFQFRQTLGDIEGRFQKVFGQFETPVAQQKAAFAKAMLMDRWQALNAAGGIAADRKQAWLTDNAEEVIKVATGSTPQLGVPADRQAGTPNFQVPKRIMDKFPKELVVDPEILKRPFDDATAPKELTELFEQLELRTSSEKRAFIKSQLRLLIQQKQGAQTTNTQEPKKKEE